MSHLVASGETLSSIASRFGVDQASLARLNGLGDPNLIVAGTTLVVRGGWVCPVAGVPCGNCGNGILEPIEYGRETIRLEEGAWVGTPVEVFFGPPKIFEFKKRRSGMITNALFVIFIVAAFNAVMIAIAMLMWAIPILRYLKERAAR